MSSSLDVLCAGIIVADHLCEPIDHCPTAGELVMTDGMLLSIGGCAANAAVDLAKMDMKVAVTGQVGNDLFGKIVKDMLVEEKVDVSHIQSSAKLPTSQTLIVNVKGEDRRFVHTFGANATFAVTDIPVKMLDHIKVLYVGGYLLMPGFKAEPLSKLFELAQSKGVKTVLDIGIPGKGDYHTHLEPVLPFTDVFLPNTDEAAIILGEKDPQKQATAFLYMKAKTVVITMGHEGAILKNSMGSWKSDIFRVDYIDGSGSGDAFDAGYIVGMLRGLDPLGCLTLASALGASCVRKVGTTPGVFTAWECDEFLQSHQVAIERLD